MTTCPACAVVVMTLLSSLTRATVSAQLMTPCVENSPERRGGIGCSIIDRKALPGDLEKGLLWHLDRFDSPEAARAAVGAASIAFDAAGTSWLMTIESRTSNHHGGHHVAAVGPLALPVTRKYSVQVQSSAFTPGMYSLVHHHSGVEAVYVIEGEACFETPSAAHKLRQGETLAVPSGTPMRAVVTGSSLRRVLAVIIHDAAEPATTRMEEGVGPPLVACE